MFSSQISKKQYSAQVLAVVLVVIVVGVIIALALMSRTMGNNRRVQEERDSADSAQLADTTLDSVKDILLSDIITWGNDPVNPCANGDASYNFTDDGCELNGLEQFSSFTEFFELDEFYGSIRDTLITQCGYEDEASTAGGFKLIFSGIGEEDEIEIEKDDVFAFIPGGTVQPATCEMEINATPLDGVSTGVVFVPLYVTLDIDGEISGYKPHRLEDITGVCIDPDGSCSSDFLGWGSPGPDFTYSVSLRKPVNAVQYYMYEMRIRPVGGDITVTRSYTDTCNVVEGALLRVSAIVNCNGNSRGREFILSEQEWAPAIFDYVLFNGVGSLENR